MSRPPAGPFIGSMSRLLWQWVRREIHAEVVAAGFHDLNPAHVAIFRNPTPDGMRPSELADEMQITKQSVNELLGHLERQGYLVRDPDPSDSRSRRIRLTDLGRRVEDVTWRAAGRAERTAAQLLGEDRVQELRRTLADLVALLGLSGEAESQEDATSTNEAR
ncbi:MAG TPA: MarR family transcriptional regulator [Acidimicrobiales bacterium]|nr:MarR family transcriptional regulator [Acidimicrobiales bacterium]